MRALAPRPPSASARRGYTKIKQLGKGAFGVVHLVTPTSPSNATDAKRKLVMKEISLRGLSPKEQQATRNEVAVLRKIEHPHVIRYHDSFIEAGTLCICMEHASGGDLDQMIQGHIQKKSRVAEAEIWRLLAQMTSALEYCHHAVHLLHRDLKPANILLNERGEVKLADFGVSKMLAMSQQLAKTQCGTPLYMSPELCAGKEYGLSSDVWALGCVVYELMALSPPWLDQCGPRGFPGGISGLMKAVASSRISLAKVTPHYSSELCELLGSLLSKDPADRPALTAVLQMPVIQRELPRPAETAGAAAEAPTETPTGAGAGAASPAASPAPSSSTKAKRLTPPGPRGCGSGGKTPPNLHAKKPPSQPPLHQAPSQPPLHQAPSQPPSHRGAAAPLRNCLAWGADAHVAAEALQKSFRRRGASAAPAAARVSPTEQPSIFAPPARPPSAARPGGGLRAARPTSAASRPPSAVKPRVVVHGAAPVAAAPRAGAASKAVAAAVRPSVGGESLAQQQKRLGAAAGPKAWLQQQREPFRPIGVS